MHDILDEIQLSEDTSVIKLKGHTKIELTDVNTGEVECIEHDNMITTGLSAWTNNHGGARCSILSQINSDIVRRELWKTLLGGIYLFDTAIPVSAKYMPAGTHMTANSFFGASNSGTPVELGSYNSVESHFNDNEIVLVYDWLTSQGNGTINSVCLCSQMGGRFGYGNRSGVASRAWAPYQYQSDFLWSYYVYRTSSSDSNYRGLFNGVLFWDNAIYAPFAVVNASTRVASIVQSNATSISIKRFRCNFTKLDVFSFIRDDSVTDVWAYGTEIISIPVTSVSHDRYVKTAGSGRPTCFIFIENDSYVSWNAGTTQSILIIDVQTQQTQTISITNPTSEKLYLSTIEFLDSTHIFVSSGSKTYVIDVTDSSLTKTINYCLHQNPSSNYYAYGGCNLSKIAPNLFLRLDTGVIYDYVDNAVWPICITTQAQRADSAYQYDFDEEEDALRVKYVYTSSYGNSSLVFMNNPWELMTINNLPEPVVKTSSKTMKVTYTLTRATT